MIATKPEQDIDRYPSLLSKTFAPWRPGGCRCGRDEEVSAMLGRAQMAITCAVLLLGAGTYAGEAAALPTPSATMGGGLSAQLPKGFEPAPRLDAVHREIGWTAADVQRLAADTAAGANQQLLSDIATAS